MREASREIVKQYKQQIIEGLCFFGILKSTYAGTAKALKRINEIRLELVDLLDEVIAE